MRTVRILSPVDGPAEVPLLVEAGAEELYAGYVPPFWREAFGPVVSCNRRSFETASLPTVDALDAVVAEASLREVPLFVAVNASPIPDVLLPRMVGMVADFARRGVRGVIVADLAFLLALRQQRFRRLQVHASTLFNAFNGAAVAFLRRAGAGRVVLPRELPVEEIARLAADRRTPLETIAMRGRCPNIEGFCTHLHDDPGRTWPCELRYAKEWLGRGGEIPPMIRAALERDEGTDRARSCGLCAVPSLAAAGVAALKIVGRGAETERKAEAVAAVRRMRDEGAADAGDRAACARRGKALYREIFGRPCRTENCYFPEFRPEEDRS